MKILQELLSLNESAMSDKHLEFQEAVMKFFDCGDSQAEEIVDALLAKDLDKLPTSTYEMILDHCDYEDKTESVLTKLLHKFRFHLN